MGALVAETLWLNGHDVSTASSQEDLLHLVGAMIDGVLQASDLLMVDASFVDSATADALSMVHARHATHTMLVIAPGDAAADLNDVVARLEAVIVRKPVDIDHVRSVATELRVMREERRS
jgi:hypothetical protein